MAKQIFINLAVKDVQKSMDFYTALGGPSGGGTLLVEGTLFSNNTSATITMSVFYYAEVDGVFCRDEEFVIYIH